METVFKHYQYRVVFETDKNTPYTFSEYLISAISIGLEICIVHMLFTVAALPLRIILYDYIITCIVEGNVGLYCIVAGVFLAEKQDPYLPLFFPCAQLIYGSINQ